MDRIPEFLKEFYHCGRPIGNGKGSSSWVWQQSEKRSNGVNAALAKVCISPHCSVSILLVLLFISDASPSVSQSNRRRRRRRHHHHQIVRRNRLLIKTLLAVERHDSLRRTTASTPVSDLPEPSVNWSYQSVAGTLTFWTRNYSLPMLDVDVSSRRDSLAVRTPFASFWQTLHS